MVFLVNHVFKPGCSKRSSWLLGSGARQSCIKVLVVACPKLEPSFVTMPDTQLEYVMLPNIAVVISPLVSKRIDSWTHETGCRYQCPLLRHHHFLVSFLRKHQGVLAKQRWNSQAGWNESQKRMVSKSVVHGKKEHLE